MNPIDALFQDLRSRKRKAFMPFVTAGDPDLATTIRVLDEVRRRGASLIEIGFPYSDPIADGSVIQASYTRALDKGLRIDAIFESLRKFTTGDDYRKQPTPLVAMVSYSLVHHRGPEKFIAQALESGLCGAIVPDLPIEEAEALVQLAQARDFKLIHLVTPTTPRERAKKIAALSSGFLYCVSVVGITGERSQLPPDLLDQLRWLRTQTDLPMCVGFGVSTPEHVHLLREVADGVIVGSALVRRLGQIGERPADDVIRDIGDHVEQLAKALHD